MALRARSRAGGDARIVSGPVTILRGGLLLEEGNVAFGALSACGDPVLGRRLQAAPLAVQELLAQRVHAFPAHAVGALQGIRSERAEPSAEQTRGRGQDLLAERERASSAQQSVERGKRPTLTKAAPYYAQAPFPAKAPSSERARPFVERRGAPLGRPRLVVFPGHRLVALYGHPESPVLGALGQQYLPASIARAKQMAASYQALSRVPVVPAFEIIATVALGFPGPDGIYSGVSSVASLRPWVERATAAGLYVVLDLQPGRASLLDQARMYEPLLAMPNVGLALDAEWKLQPGQLPLRQIGSVSINEVNSVVRWLAGLTAELRLPQKLLVLHQFQLSMIQDERRLDTSNGDLAIVIHMDGQGTQGVKQDTWNAVTAAAPPGVFFGWKNFFIKDHPMVSPRDTMSKRPQPVMISYQ